jgi:NAD-dependent dihydropyrimidine dehydrogenase PreA subunit
MQDRNEAYALLKRRAAPVKNLEETMGWTVTVGTDKCSGCGECVDVCPVEVYELQDGKSVAVNEEECLGCESCVEVCETNALTVEEN